MSHSIEEVSKFLSYLAEKGFMQPNTVTARKAACNNIFSILDPEEQTAEFVRDNLDVVARRLENKNPEKFTGSTLETYKSRTSSTLEDFFAWKQDKRATEDRIAKGGRKTSGTPKKNTDQTAKTKAGPKTSPQPQAAETSAPKSDVWPLTLPIGPNKSIKVEIPRDLTKAELMKLGMFLYPYCTDLQAGDMSPNWAKIDG